MILGGGYEEEDAKAIREACKGHLNVPRLIFDKDKPAGVPPRQEYAKIVVGAGELLLKKLKEGKIGEDTVYHYLIKDLSCKLCRIWNILEMSELGPVMLP